MAHSATHPSAATSSALGLGHLRITENNQGRHQGDFR
jgi:hypothetical protein